MPAAPGANPALVRALRKAAGRLIPFLLLLYILAFLDRVNIGFAKQAFLRSTGLSEAAYAFGAGVFFAGYALLEIPSTLLMMRVGPRAWFCRIMVSWGLISAAMMFARSAGSFYLLRFLLGVAEAGFFPGVICYLAAWFPAGSRGRMLGLFYFGAPLAQILGGPLSGWLLDRNGVAGLQGWQWLFLVEGLLAAGAGMAAFWMLANRPEEARWLSPAECWALRAALTAEEAKSEGTQPASAGSFLGDGRIWYFGLVYGLIQMSVYGVTFYLPSEVARLLGREAGLIVGLVTAIPWVCALAAAYLVPRLAGASSRRAAVAAAALAGSAIGIAAAAADQPAVALAGFCLAAAGFIGAQPIFWTFPAAEFSGRRAAAGIALINSAGAVGSFLAPNLKTWAETAWASPRAGLITLAATTFLAAGLMSRLPARLRQEAAQADRS